MSMALSNELDNFPIHEGTLLASCYEVQAFLGEGTFGKVAKCTDTVTGAEVAIKITKDEPGVTEQAWEEIKILEELKTLDPEECNIVRWNGWFFHERFICLEFELLDLSLHDYMEKRHYDGLPLDEIRPVIHQLATALLHLDGLGIMHADLKPDNIMVRDRRQEPLQVKIIDFGLACQVSDAVQGSCAQTLWYRAPEVMLGMVFAEPIDMWSLGLIAAQLALGYPLFPGEDEYDTIKFIVDTLGPPPDYLLNCGQKSAHFFNIEGSYKKKTWRLKTPEEFFRQTGHRFRDTRYFHLSSLDVLTEMADVRNEAERNELRNFVDLLKKMLLVDKHGRIIPLKVLEHPFFSVEQHADSSENIETLMEDMTEAEPQNINSEILMEDTTEAEPQNMNRETLTEDMEEAEPQNMYIKLLTLDMEEAETPNMNRETLMEYMTEAEPQNIYIKLLTLDMEEAETPNMDNETLMEYMTEAEPQNIHIKLLTLDMKETESDVTQKPSSETKSVHSLEDCNTAPETAIPHEETVCTPENESAELEDEEDEAEVIVETTNKKRGRVKRFFKRIRKAFSRWFHRDNNTS